MLQTELQSWSQARGNQLRQRVGIHLGEVVIEEHTGPGKAKDLYGGQLDVCARVMALAGADQILMTRAVFDNARRVLRGEDIYSLGVVLYQLLVGDVTRPLTTDWADNISDRCCARI